jgi:DNA-binding LacI/PurR family transcriptional regulator
VCCFNDLFAGMVIAAARSIGLEVPGDLPVMGIGDEPLGSLLNPTLTTIRYDVTGVGAHIRDRLREVLDGGPAAAAVSSDAVDVIPRDSAASRHART